jgi:fatty acid-binding protein DegV
MRFIGAVLLDHQMDSISPDLSAAYNAALAASRLVQNVPICVSNSPTVPMGQTTVVLEAARAAASGATLAYLLRDPSK